MKRVSQSPKEQHPLHPPASGSSFSLMDMPHLDPTMTVAGSCASPWGFYLPGGSGAAIGAPVGSPGLIMIFKWPISK